jgi:hypothetical protein
MQAEQPAGPESLLHSDWVPDCGNMDSPWCVSGSLEDNAYVLHLGQDAESAILSFGFEKTNTTMAVNTNDTYSAPVSTQQHWAVFRCCRPPETLACPRTTASHLIMLKRTPQDHAGWNRWIPPWSIPGDDFLIIKVSESARDTLAVTTERLLQKELALNLPDPELPQSSNATNLSDALLLLPPTRVLEFLLRSHALCFTGYYFFAWNINLGLDETLSSLSSSITNLPTLLMIAQGASSIASREAHVLASGLLEISRATIFDLLQKDALFANDPGLSHTVLLFISQAAWSGDKWQMHSAIAMRSLFSNVLQAEPSSNPHHKYDMGLGHEDHQALNRWSDWTYHERNSRLTYTWFLIDQEMALFHDRPLSSCIADMTSPLPDTDFIWNAINARAFMAAFSKEHGFSTGNNARPISLRGLFGNFLNEDPNIRAQITPLRLRLLLLPLQAQVYQYCQLLSCYPGTSPVNGCQAMTLTSTRNRLNQTMMLCRDWQQLAEAYIQEHDTCPMMQTGFIMFHLISLNSVTDFREVEDLARSEFLYKDYAWLYWRHSKCIYASEEAIYHCGQVLRLMRTLPTDIRAPWWAAAIYRVALILWADSLMRRDPDIRTAPFAIDQLMPNDPIILRYLNEHQGIPCLTMRDGTLSRINDPASVLQHFTEIFDSVFATQFSDGIRAKLEALESHP